MTLTRPRASLRHTLTAPHRLCGDGAPGDRRAPASIRAQGRARTRHRRGWRVGRVAPPSHAATHAPPTRAGAAAPVGPDTSGYAAEALGPVGAPRPLAGLSVSGETHGGGAEQPAHVAFPCLPGDAGRHRAARDAERRYRGAAFAVRQRSRMARTDVLHTTLSVTPWLLTMHRVAA